MALIAAVARVSGRDGSTTRLLIVSRDAKRVTPAVGRKLDAAFPGFARVDFDARHDLVSSLSSHATVVVAGGDGTVGCVARALAGSRRRLGIVPLGTSTTLRTVSRFLRASTGQSAWSRPAQFEG
jgi:hypothetical protein